MLPASSPVVTSESVMVAMTDEYERAGCEVMTLPKSLLISSLHGRGAERPRVKSVGTHL